MNLIESKCPVIFEYQGITYALAIPSVNAQYVWLDEVSSFIQFDLPIIKELINWQKACLLYMDAILQDNDFRQLVDYQLERWKKLRSFQ